jgi:alpha-glucosidase
MFNLRSAWLCLLVFCAVETLTAQGSNTAALKVTSPNGQIVFLLFEGQAAKGASEPAVAGLRYAVEFHGKRLIAESKLGLEAVGQPALGPAMRNTGAETGTHDETYSIPVGKTSSVRDHYNGLHADCEDADGRKLAIEVRVYDDGAAFRYVVPEQPALKQVKIAREDTEFIYAKDATTYPLILDGYQSSWEDEYQERLVSGLHHDWLIGLPLLAEEPGIGW